MMKPELLAAIERSTGMTIAELQAATIPELRLQAETRYGKPMRVGPTPVVMLSKADSDRELDRVLGLKLKG